MLRRSCACSGGSTTVLPEVTSPNGDNVAALLGLNVWPWSPWRIVGRRWADRSRHR
jgi:hypothetical protein